MLAVLGHEADPGQHGVERRGDPDLAAAEKDLARVARVGPEDEPHRLGPPRPDEPTEPDDLAGHHRKSDAAHPRATRQVLDPQHLFTDGAVWRLGEHRGEGPAHHHADDVVDARLFRRRDPGDLTIFHHRDPVGDPEHLFEAVRNIDDADPFGAQPGDDAMQALGIAGREDGGRLVEDDDADLLGERLGDLDDLLVRDREVADGAPRVDVEPEPVEEVARPPVQTGPCDDGRQLPHEDVLGHRKVGGERRLLVDHRDAARGRDPRVEALLGLAADQDLPGVSRDLAGQNPHQRRLAGPILAEQRVDLAGRDVEVDGPQGPHPSEGPRDAFELDEVRHPTVPIRSKATGSHGPPHDVASRVGVYQIRVQA